MMDFDCFKWDYVIFGIGNEYPNFYADVYKLKSDLVGGYVKKRLTICELELGKQTWNRGLFGDKLVLFDTSKIHDFWCSDSLMS